MVAPALGRAAPNQSVQCGAGSALRRLRPGLVTNIPAKIVIRTYAPAWRWVLLTIALVGIAAASFFAFRLGLYKAGFNATQEAAARQALQQQIAQLQQTEHQLRLQLATTEEARVGQARERAELARTIGELQAQVERGQQDVQFYRGLVAQPSGSPDQLVRVQQFHITAEEQPQKFVLRFTLNRVMQPEQAITGALAITVDGSQNGAPATADLATLTGGQAQLAFDFRYYAHLDEPITLPAAFKPESVTIELRPARKGAGSYRQTFIWDVDPT